MEGSSKDYFTEVIFVYTKDSQPCPSWHFGPDNAVLWGLPCTREMLSSISGLCPLEASSSIPTTTQLWQPNCLHILPNTHQGAKLLRITSLDLCVFMPLYGKCFFSYLHLASWERMIWEVRGNGKGKKKYALKNLLVKASSALLAALCSGL